MIQLKNLTREGKFSFTRPGCSYQIVKQMKTFMNSDLKDLVITDGTACVGGDTLRFSLEFSRVNAIEKNFENFTALSANCGESKNVNLYNGDCIQLLENLEQDVVYFDPPWGGPEYWKLPTLRLKVGNMQLHEIVEHILATRKAKHVFIKAPANVWLDGFHNLKGVARFAVKNITKRRNSNEFYLLVCVSGAN